MKWINITRKVEIKEWQNLRQKESFPLIMKIWRGKKMATERLLSKCGIRKLKQSIWETAVRACLILEKKGLMLCCIMLDCVCVCVPLGCGSQPE